MKVIASFRATVPVNGLYPGSAGGSPRPSKTQGVPHVPAKFTSLLPNSASVPPDIAAVHPDVATKDPIPDFLQTVKEPVARKAIAYLMVNECSRVASPHYS